MLFFLINFLIIKNMNGQTLKQRAKDDIALIKSLWDRKTIRKPGQKEK